MKQSVLIFAISCLLASCGSNDSADHQHPAAQTSNVNKAVLEADVTDGRQVVVLLADDNMKFNAKEVKVKAGMPVELTLKHTGKAPKATMGHNVVILRPDVVVSDFVERANAAAATDYIPEELTGQIVVHTRMLGGGESDTQTFTFEKPGTYTFLCTFPGHSMIMKGKFVVE